MKSRSRQTVERFSRWLPLLVGVSIAVAPSASVAAEDEGGAESGEPAVLSPEEFFEGGTNTYDNWVEFGLGGWFPSGNYSQFQQRHRTENDVFGGLEDFHFKQDLGKDVILQLDGRAIVDNDDYKISIDVDKWDLGYAKVKYEEFRTWYNGDGGYYPAANAWYPLGDDALSIDRGEFSFETGLRLEGVPDVTFKYTHRFRDGEKGSTSWGQATILTGSAVASPHIAPSTYDIDEEVDIFELDVTHQIKATGLGAGVRYETGDLENTFDSSSYVGNTVTLHTEDREGTSYDLLNVHAFTETWIKENLFFSSGFLFANVDNDFYGYRNLTVFPGYLSGAVGYPSLNGGSRLQEYTLNLNLMAKPWKHFSIVPSVRVQKEDWDADSSGFGVGVGSAPSPGAFSASGDREALDVRERLEARFTGVTNWVFYGRGEWTQGDGKLNENGGLDVYNRPVFARETEDTRLFQKYVAGINWYPMRRVSVDAQYYYKRNQYDYDHVTDSTIGYPAEILMTRLETHDANVRLTWRPSMKLTFVSRYDFQYNTTDSEANLLASAGETETAQTTSHIFAQNISWTPWSRLFLQLGFNYVLNETETFGADSAGSEILDAQNDYWTLNLSSGFALSDKTDLHAGYFFYNADNDQDNPAYGIPYGAGATEHGITCGVSHQLRENIRLNLRYGFAKYEDDTSGGNLDYEAHLVYGSVQYRF